MGFHSYGESGYGESGFSSSDRGEYYRKNDKIYREYHLLLAWRREIYLIITESEEKRYPKCYEPGVNDPKKRMERVLSQLVHIKEGHQYWPFVKALKENGEYLSSLEAFTEHLYDCGYARRPK